MTSLSVLELPLRRLFARVDFAAQPKSEQVKAALKLWSARRTGSVAPARAGLGPIPWDRNGAFSFSYDPEGGRYILDTGAENISPVLGSFEAGHDLATAAYPRTAVRLRRLFEAVRQAGEPVVAEFVDPRAHLFVEILVAPLSSDGRRIDGIFGALSARASSELAYRAHSLAADKGELMLFALAQEDTLANAAAAHLGIRLSPHELRVFEDGEHKARPLVSVRDRDVYVLSSLWGDQQESVNDKLCRLLFFIGCLRDGGAGRITAVIPYFAYARKDRKTKARDPVTMRYVAQLLEAMGVSRVVAFEIHNVAAYQNAFRCPTEHLDASGLFAQKIVELVEGDALTVVSPDLGGGKRAEEFREHLESLAGRPVEKAFMEKRRSGGVVTGDLFAGDVKDRTAIIVDDLISSGTTMARCARLCHERGAKRIFLVATHGLFTAEAAKTLDAPFISEILVTDTVPQIRQSAAAIVPKLRIVSVAERLGETVWRLHCGDSITEMLGGQDAHAAQSRVTSARG